jgi:hypothetical protein
MLLLEDQIINEEGLIDEIEQKKKEGREKYRTNREGENRNPATNYIGLAIQRATHRTHRFIRWLRQQIYRQLPWRKSMYLLAKFWLIKKN